MKRKPFSLLLCILGTAMFLSYHIYYQTEKTVNNKKVENFLEEKVVKNNSPKVGNKAIDSIYGVLEIPKIKLKQAYYEKKSKKNTVEKHLELLEDKNNLLVLAAHSGNSYVGYFKNLDKLSLDDCVYLYRKDKKERYVVSDIYELDKKGTITINHNEKEKVLVLTTCSKQKDKQLIVVCKYLKNT